MLKSLPFELECTDDVDETISKLKWTKTADKQLQKLNRDCNMTGGLLSVLVLASEHVSCYVATLTQNLGLSMGLLVL